MATINPYLDFNGNAADVFWGAYFGMLSDKYGVQWLFNYDHNQNQ